MKKHLFLLSIGPVQSFIAQARKTQDLFAGSRLISSLASKAFDMFEAKLGKEKVTLLFPAFKDESDKPVMSNPNRFAALVDATISADTLREAGKSVKQELVQGFVTESLERMPFLKGNARAAAKRQLENHLEIFWAAMPTDKSSYNTSFKELESHIASIKNYREWRQIPEQGRKCGVDGQRNLVVYRLSQAESGKGHVGKLFSKDDPDRIALIDTAAEQVVPVWSLEPGEGLSAVSYAKRTFEQVAHEFPSTARVCLLNVLEKIKHWKEFEAFEEASKPVLRHSNDQLLFEENINTTVFRNTGVFGSDERAIEDAMGKTQECYNDLVQKMKAENIKEGLNTKYYAIMVFDGDQMGKWLGGQHLQEDSELMKFQMKMRDLLRDYGKWAMDTLDPPRGKAVYAGGDDFLGFLNLNHLYEVLKEMRCAFDEKINQPLQEKNEGFKVRKDEMFSFSAGIAIGHYKQPLGMVLDEARAAEKVAKKAGRNAFAISVIRHSGGTTRAVQPFGNNKESLCKRIDAMETIAQQLTARNFSNKFIHNIIAETRYWQEQEAKEMFSVELNRLLKRARNQTAQPKDLKEMEAAITLLYEAPADCKTSKLHNPLENFIATLRVCDFIYRTTTIDENEHAKS